MTHPRGLSDAEATVWEKLAATVEPIHPASVAATKIDAPPRPMPKPAARRKTPKPSAPAVPAAPAVAARGRNPVGNLDGHWDKRLKGGEITPDLSLDLHDHGLDAAYSRLMAGMEQARSIGARVVLVVTGKARPVDPADRATRRGAIRAKILDWLAASEHGESIAAIRKAHRRHGGDGALYVVLRRQR
ncbi:Smr/MutS family protein [Parerythrobacter jejuensis]|uniref:DNA mismatch repair protein MutS n=1 Tax=Parerythrobacter jejuensis TaxID=795812 RepID=A0A845AJQ1_9SPHN|nr:Smr/MutS family protein [Parerythrobacter jejuensis]MXP30480.1 DNA mismatch repair protein MutS [Parerythrobacter jejuensis]MXP33240.1 DNA mismatch repair protein MutS [Parerythrobacter jejuensis]